MPSTPNPEQLLFSKTEEMPGGHMWQRLLTVRHTILMTDTLWKQKLDTTGRKESVKTICHLFERAEMRAAVSRS